jgi:flagellar FliJ protein
VTHEPQLGGVVRVRSIRERDSRTGLTTALTEEQRAAAQVVRIEEQLATLPEPAGADLAAFAARQHTAAALGEALSRARQELAAAGRIAAAARSQWHTDSSRLSAVESLVERRAAARQRELRRLETRELDEVAEDLWRRQHAGEEEPG